MAMADLLIIVFFISTKILTPLCVVYNPFYLSLNQHHDTTSFPSTLPLHRIIIFITMNTILLRVLVVFALALCASATVYCSRNSNDYGCGVDYYEPDYFTQDPADKCHCCCYQEDGGGRHKDTCDDGNSNPFRSVPKGCFSCMGPEACYDVLNSKIGDFSCVGGNACKYMRDSKIQRGSCVPNGIGLPGRNDGITSACRKMIGSNVGEDSCSGFDACLGMVDSNIALCSCVGHEACSNMKDSNVAHESCLGERSCEGGGVLSGTMESSTVGPNSCRSEFSCAQDGDIQSAENGIYKTSTSPDLFGRRLTIGSFSCNKKHICRWCENDSVVPDYACNGDRDDYTWVYEPRIGPGDGTGTTVPTCNYCRVSTKTPLLFCFSRALLSPLTFYSKQSELRSLSAVASASSPDSGRRLTEIDLNISCEDLTEKLKNYLIEHAQAVEMFKEFVHDHDVIDNCSGKPLSNLVEFISDEDDGTCTVKINLLLKTRPKNGNETPFGDRIKEKVDEFCARDILEEFGFSCDSIEVTDQVIEDKDCSKAAGGQGSRDSSINEGGAKAGKHGKSSQAEALVERYRTREHKSGKGKGKNGK